VGSGLVFDTFDSYHCHCQWCLKTYKWSKSTTLLVKKFRGAGLRLGGGLARLTEDFDMRFM